MYQFTNYENGFRSSYAMSLEDFEPQTIYTYSEGDGYIYGAMVYEDGSARLNISQSPSRDNDDYIVVNFKAASPKVTVNYETGILSTTTAMEYSLDGGDTWKACTANMKIQDLEWNDNTKLDILFRTAAQGLIFASDAVEVSVEQKVTGIRLNVTEKSLEGLQTCLLTATIMPDNAYNKKFTWSSED